MKLKSKLIATIVSICAAIAVMGVGVWAATNTFSVTVTNQINLAFANLPGTVTIKGMASANGTDAADVAFSKAALIYDSTGVANTDDTNAVEITAASTLYSTKVIADENKVANVAETVGYFDNEDGTKSIKNDTQNAVLAYEVVYTPIAGGEGEIEIVVNGTAPANTTYFTPSYYIATGDANFATVSAGTTYKAAVGTKVRVLCVLTYTNTNLVSLTVDGNTWVPVVSFTAVSASETGTTIPAAGTITGTVANGVLA